MIWSSIALAQAAATPAAEQPPMWMSLVPFVVMIAVFYFLVARPQAKRQRDQAKFLGELKRGDEVFTSSGILGRIEGMTDQLVTLEIASGVRIKILRSQISGTGQLSSDNKKG